MITTSTDIVPSENLLVVINEFPKPQNITDTHSWFGLINQVACGYYLRPIIASFWDLVKQSNIHMDQGTRYLILEYKRIILENITEGIHAFDPSRQTCLQTYWIRNGVAYLLQKHCSCELTNNLLCCPEGWKLVYVGSHFTS